MCHGVWSRAHGGDDAFQFGRLRRLAKPNLSERVMEPELMDRDSTELETFRACLVDLAVVNQLTLAYRPTLSFLNRLANAGRLPKGRPVVILDVGSGYGDMLRKVDRWAMRRGIAVKLIGLDLNLWSAR